MAPILQTQARTSLRSIARKARRLKASSAKADGRDGSARRSAPKRMYVNMSLACKQRFPNQRGAYMSGAGQKGKARKKAVYVRRHRRRVSSIGGPAMELNLGMLGTTCGSGD